MCHVCAMCAPSYTWRIFQPVRHVRQTGVGVWGERAHIPPFHPAHFMISQFSKCAMPPLEPRWKLLKTLERNDSASPCVSKKHRSPRPLFPMRLATDIMQEGHSKARQRDEFCGQGTEAWRLVTGLKRSFTRTLRTSPSRPERTFNNSEY
jgi:hypothetical protein